MANRKPHTLVIGGTHGIGRAVTELFLRRRQTVSVIGRRPPAKPWPESMNFWEADLADFGSVPAQIEKMLRKNGPLENLIFLQRFRGGGDPWQAEMDVSLTATKRLIELVQDRFSDTGPNAIVMVTSIAAHLIAEEQSLGYHAAKGALRQMARFYACALGPRGIRVNCVSPGIILKPEAEAFYKDNRALVALYERIAPLRRFGTAKDVASVIGFLCSENSAFITGQDIVVDGGISLAWQASLARQLVPIEERRVAARPAST